MDAPRGRYAERNEPVTRRQIVCDPIPMRDLEQGQETILLSYLLSEIRKENGGGQGLRGGGIGSHLMAQTFRFARWEKFCGWVEG